MSQNVTKQNPPLRIIVVDDHQIFRQGVLLNLGLHEDFKVVRECANGVDALEAALELRPDIMLMDINLPKMNGIQVTRQVTGALDKTRVIIMTAFDDMEQVIHAIRAGASAYCSKDVQADRLVEIIRHVHQGHFVVHDVVFDREGIDDWVSKGVESIAEQYYMDPNETHSPLSPREMEILRYVTRGMSNKEIALSLDISHQTVKNHMTSILRKLAVDDRTQAAVFALRRGWVRLQDTTRSGRDEQVGEPESE